MDIKVTDKLVRADLILSPSQNLYTGIKYLESKFGKLNTLEEDLLNIASAIYCSDLFVKRDERENFIRTINLEIDVVNRSIFDRFKNELQKSLLILTKDNWFIRFNQKDGTPTIGNTWNQKEGTVLLFSGGLDSMCAASDFLENKKDLVLVSHMTKGNNVVNDSQDVVCEILEKHYNKKLEHIKIRVYGRNNKKYIFPKDRENTQRARSFLFLTLGAIVTRRLNFNKLLFMAENGQFAIHLPLNQARVGPFSTHTADPEFLSTIQSLFRQILGNPEFEIVNPYLYKTKAEVFSVLPDELKKKARHSASCWMIGRLNQHCGQCLPCISRRIAIEYNGLAFKEYKCDLFNKDHSILSNENSGRVNMSDYLEFIQNLHTGSNDQISFLYPELFKKSLNMSSAIDMYKRMAMQSFDVISKYPYIQKLL